MRVNTAQLQKAHGAEAVDVLSSLSSAVHAVCPEYLLRNSVKLRDHNIIVTDFRGITREIGFEGRISVIAIGKAALPMMTTIHEILGDVFDRGILVVPRGTPARKIGRVRVLHGSHPVPDAGSRKAAMAMIDFIREVQAGDLVMAAISGGASSLASLPPSDVPLAEKIAVTKSLLRSGAEIHEINTVRKHLSEIKGGRLLRYLKPSCKLLSLVISDVVGNDLGAIGSGLTAPDPTTYADAVHILQRYRIKVPRNAADWLSRGIARKVSESPKPGDHVFESVTNVILGDNAMACRAAVSTLSSLGIRSSHLGSEWTCTARQFGSMLHKRISDLGGNSEYPVAIVAGGETIVSLGSSRSLGGRNQEAALSFAHSMNDDRHLVAGFLGTDGIDGNSPAAGGLVSKKTCEVLGRAGLAQLLKLHRSFIALKKANSLIVTGPTGTNVGDIAVVIAYGRKGRNSLD